MWMTKEKFHGCNMLLWKCLTETIQEILSQDEKQRTGSIPFFKKRSSIWWLQENNTTALNHYGTFNALKCFIGPAVGVVRVTLGVKTSPAWSDMSDFTARVISTDDYSSDHQAFFKKKTTSCWQIFLENTSELIHKWPPLWTNYLFYITFLLTCIKKRQWILIGWALLVVVTCWIPPIFQFPEGFSI